MAVLRVRGVEKTLMRTTDSPFEPPSPVMITRTQGLHRLCTRRDGGERSVM
jgi:hypothetical protein